MTTFDLSTIDLAVGTHTIKVKAKASGYLDSDFSNELTYTVYSITSTLTYVTAGVSNSTKIGEGGSVTLTFTANADYALPDSVSVTGATAVWTKATGTLVLSNPTAHVTFSISGTQLYDYFQQGTILTILNAPYTQVGSEVTII